MKVGKEDILAARKADLVSYLQSKGYTLKKEGKNHRVRDFSGVLVKDNMYTDFVHQTGGNAIDFCVKVLRLSVPEAVQDLLQQDYQVATVTEPEAAQEHLEIPERNRNHRRVIAYLTQSRGIPIDLVLSLIKEELLYQDRRGNAVFLCKDEMGEAKEAIIRGTLTEVSFKQRVGYGIYPFVLFASSEKKILVLTEAPIETLSFLAIYPQSRKCIHAALGGVGFIEAIDRLLHIYSGVNRIVAAFNHDYGGSVAVEHIQERYADRVEIVPFYPQIRGHDWNDQWLSTKKDL